MSHQRLRMYERIMRVKFSRESCFVRKKSVTGLHYPQSPNLQSSKKYTFVTQLVANLTFPRGAAFDHSLSHVCLGPGSSNPHTCRVCPNPCHGSEEYLDFPSKTYKFLNLEALGLHSFRDALWICITLCQWYMNLENSETDLWWEVVGFFLLGWSLKAPKKAISLLSCLPLFLLWTKFRQQQRKWEFASFLPITHFLSGG